MTRSALFSALFTVALAGCQCGTVNPGADAGPTDDAGLADGGGGDAGLADAGEADAGLPDASVYLPDGGLSCTPLRDGCAAGGLACCAGLSCQQGSCQVPGVNPCGLNSLSCGGQCVVVLNDPLNCGACGLTCAAGTVCSKGACVPMTQCPPGLTACQQRCVDLQSDNTFCGACNATASCATGTGCSRGACVPTVVLDGGAPACVGGGAPVRVSSDAGSSCTGTLAQVSFRWSVCSCTNLAASSELRTDGFDSTRGAPDSGLLGAGIAANGTFSSSSVWDVGGTAWFGGGMATARGTVRQRLHARGAVTGGQSLVMDDARIQGSVTNLHVAGTLFVTDAGSVGGGVIADGGIVIAPFVVDAPCDCAPSQLLDVAGMVADGVANNDNAVVGLDPALFDGAGNNVRLDLPCGRYALTRLVPTGAITIAVHGRTALFIAGDVDLSNALDLIIDPTSELDIFIGGNLLASSQVHFGSVEAPAQLRIYVAGTTVSTSAASTVAGNFYLPNASYSPSASVDLYGSVFARSIQPSARFEVHYDQAILSAGSACQQPGADAGTAVDAGSAPDAGAGCTSCRDCGNQACNAGACGACATDSDCCAPLVCAQGMCIPQIN